MRKATAKNELRNTAPRFNRLDPRVALLLLKKVAMPILQRKHLFVLCKQTFTTHSLCKKFCLVFERAPFSVIKSVSISS